MFNKFLLATTLASVLVTSLASFDAWSQDAQGDFTSSESTIPVSDDAREEKILEEREAKVSVIPGEGFEQSSIPVGNPRCYAGSNCPEPLNGGRVRFWFVGIEMNNAGGHKGDGWNPVGTSSGFGTAGGVFFMRRLGRGYYEIRNLVGLELGFNQEGDPSQIGFRTPVGVRTKLDNGLYLSMFDDDVARHPFTLIMGGKAVEQTTLRGNLPRTQALTGALQLSAGFILNTNSFNNKLTGELDIWRTAIAMFNEDELGPGTDAGSRRLNSSIVKGPRSWGVSNTFASGPMVLDFEVGKANFEGPLNESIVRVNLNTMIRVGTINTPQNLRKYRGAYLNIGFGLTKYSADAPNLPEAENPTHSINQVDWNAQLGVGFKSWPSQKDRRP